jgi:hypothetical protein
MPVIKYLRKCYHYKNKTKMEEQNLNQYQANQNRIEPKISVSRDGKWIIIRIPGMEQAVVKSVNYFKKILESAEKKQANTPYNIREIKD